MRRNFNADGTARVKNPKIILIVPMIFVIIGLTLVFFAFKQKNDNDNFMKTAVPVSAECTRVWVTSSTDDDGDTNYYYHADFRRTFCIHRLCGNYSSFENFSKLQTESK